MKELFYLSGLLFVIFELLWIYKAKTNIKEAIKLKHWLKNFKHNPMPINLFPKHVKDYIVKILSVIFLFTIWVVIGFFTKYCEYYIAYFILQTMVLLPMFHYLVNPHTKLFRYLQIGCALITIAFILYVLGMEFNFIK